MAHNLASTKRNATAQEEGGEERGHVTAKAGCAIRQFVVVRMQTLQQSPPRHPTRSGHIPWRSTIEMHQLCGRLPPTNYSTPTLELPHPTCRVHPLPHTQSHFSSCPCSSSRWPHLPKTLLHSGAQDAAGTTTPLRWQPSRPNHPLATCHPLPSLACPTSHIHQLHWHEGCSCNDLWNSRHPPLRPLRHMAPPSPPTSTHPTSHRRWRQWPAGDRRGLGSKWQRGRGQ